MPVLARSPDVKTPLARLSYPNLKKPQTKEDGSLQYNFTLLFPKNSDLTGTMPGGKKVDLRQLVADLAEEAWPGKSVQMIKDGLIKNPFLDGDGPQGMNKKKGVRNDGYAGTTFIRCGSGGDYPIKVYGKNAQLADPADAYAGCYVYAVINAYAWTSQKQPYGISFGASLVQIAKDGEKLGGGGGADPDKFLDVIADDGEDAPSSARAGAGASSLFS